MSTVMTSEGRTTGVALEDGTEFYAPIVVSALDPRRTFTELVNPRELPTDLVDAIRRYRFQGVSSKVNFALSGRRSTSSFEGRDDHLRVRQHRADRGLRRARLRRGEVRLVLDAAVSRHVHPERR
ncbi:MAG: hypothetical protein U0838_03460 [Chloroflexota bacterium]